MGGPRPSMGRVAAWRPHAAVVFGSGLATTPRGAVLDEELPYERLGWPATGAPGHGNILRLVHLPSPGVGELRLALACGRPHGYEGWDEAELGRPARDLAAAGVRRLVLTNSCGSLDPNVGPGRVVVCQEVVDLQRPPEGEEPPRLGVAPAASCVAVAAALGGPATATTGTYVAVAGPQFETPAEVAWLAGYGDVVGMSAAPEVRAALESGIECCLLALVANPASAVDSHGDVLAAGAALAALLSRWLVPAVGARWPDLTAATTGGMPWTSCTT